MTKKAPKSVKLSPEQARIERIVERYNTGPGGLELHSAFTYTSSYGDRGPQAAWAEIQIHGWVADLLAPFDH